MDDNVHQTIDSSAMMAFFESTTATPPSEPHIPAPNQTEDPFHQLFFSPTTESPNQPLPYPSQVPDPLAQLNSFIASAAVPASAPPSISAQLAPNYNPSTSTPPKSQPTLIQLPSKLNIHPSSSDDDSAITTAPSPRRGFARLSGKKRTLSEMRSVAKRNAPNVSLSNDELVQISRMQESEASLAESKELYSSLSSFKRCLSKMGYRLASIYLDPAPRPDPAKPTPDPADAPFAFVLNKTPAASQPPPEEPSNSYGSIPEQNDSVPNRSKSVTAPTVDKDPARTDPSPGQPRKRQRISHQSEKDSGSPGPQRHSCAVCTKKMSDLGTLVRHFRHAHQEMKPFTCPKCKGYYSSEGTLWHHISNVHSDLQRIHKCEYCDASYDSSGAKTRHVHGTHHVERPLYSCPFPDCARTFVFPAHLENHANFDHSGFKPFMCEQCTKAFSSANGLVRHSREVHRKGKAYTCPICSGGLTKRCHLKRHLIKVHLMPLNVVEEEMKKHPNPGDITVVTAEMVSP